MSTRSSTWRVPIALVALGTVPVGGTGALS